MEIKLCSEEGENRIFGLIAGRAGVGKPHQLTTLPKTQSLLVSVERGHLTLRGSNYAYVEPKSYDELVGFLNGFEKRFGEKIKYLYIDSLSEIYDLIRHEARTQYKPSQNYAKHEDIEDKMISLIRMCRSYEKISVFFTCHVKDDKDGLAMVENLAFDGKLPAKVLKQFDFCFHLGIKEEEGKIQRFMITSPLLSKCAKARVSEFIKTKIEDVEPANLYRLCQKLLGGTE